MCVQAWTYFYFYVGSVLLPESFKCHLFSVGSTSSIWDSRYMLVRPSLSSSVVGLSSHFHLLEINLSQVTVRGHPESSCHDAHHWRMNGGVECRHAVPLWGATHPTSWHALV